MQKFKIFLKTFVISGWCLAIFIGFGYYYLTNKTFKAEIENESVPYYAYTPENKGLVFTFGTKQVYFYLDFELNSVTTYLDFQECEFENDYQVNYTVKAEYNLIANAVDYFDGINIDYNGETLRYCGVQVVDLLSRDNSKEARVKIISAIFEKMNKCGVGVDFFNLLIKNSKTNLKMPDCYFWCDYMDDISRNIVYMGIN